MKNKLSSNKLSFPLITEESLLHSYSEYYHLIQKYQNKFKDKNSQNDSLNIKSLILDYLNFKYENGEKWIKNIISIIKNKHFLSQNILISIFNLDLYDIIIKLS